MSIWSSVVPHERGIAGWDLGGAHLKLALFDAGGRLQHVAQTATPLWQGLHHLDDALAAFARDWPLADYDHVLTMTGELVDLFDSRGEGVQALAKRCTQTLGDVRFYAGPHGFIAAGQVAQQAADIASANWYATASWIAEHIASGLLVDVGSTTSDLLLLQDGVVDNRGYTDRERLASGELVYTGVVRTPVMAVTQQLPFAGEWQPPANEHFATMADVYRILGWLPEAADLQPAADGRDKSVAASMRRLARMLGADLSDAGAEQWRNVAAYVADRQLDSVSRACQRLISRGLPAAAPLIGAGSGSFLVRRLAVRLDRPYLDFDAYLPASQQGGLSAAVCAPAVAVALLAGRERLAWAC